MGCLCSRTNVGSKYDAPTLNTEENLRAADASPVLSAENETLRQELARSREASKELQARLQEAELQLEQRSQAMTALEQRRVADASTIQRLQGDLSTQETGASQAGQLESALRERDEAEEEEKKQQETEAKKLEEVKKREEAEKARAEEAAKRKAEEETKKEQEEANFNLEEPQKLSAFLKYADIRLLRVEYLYELLRQKRLLPRRQEVEESEEWGLVSHEEVSEWAAGTRDAMLISVSHAWETREHPDPCGDQLKRLVSCLSLYDAAYFSEIWVFYDYVSLFQYERQADAENESFRRSMSHMHMCYAHECNWTVRLEALTPDDVWEAALQNSEHLVMVYDDKSKSVRGRPLKELMPNRVPYRDRGWCKAEVEWSSCRSRSEQNQRIDAPGSEVNSERALKGKVPMAPEVFQEDLKKAAFTHRDDAGEVQKLQQDIYHEKVSACEEAVLTNLPEGELGRLAKALKDYRKLKVLRLRNIEVGEAEAEEFCKALGLNDTITKLEIRIAESHRERCSALWKALADALKSNCTVTHVKLDHNRIDDQGAKALAEALKSNCTVTHVDLHSNWIGVKGAKALAEALWGNCTVTVNLNDCQLNHLGRWRPKDIEESAKHPADATKSQAWKGKVRIKELASQLTTNSGTTRLELRFQQRTAEDCKALAAALKLNCTVTHINLGITKIGDQGAKALADALKSNKTVTDINLELNEIGAEGAKALADALNFNCTVTHVKLEGNEIRDEGAKALADALKSNKTVTDINLGSNSIGDEGAKALADALKSNKTVTDINLKLNRIGDQGAQALADALKSNKTVTKIDLHNSMIGDEGAKALADALKCNRTVCIKIFGKFHIGEEGAKALEDFLKFNHVCVVM